MRAPSANSGKDLAQAIAKAVGETLPRVAAGGDYGRLSVRVPAHSDTAATARGVAEGVAAVLGRRRHRG